MPAELIESPDGFAIKGDLDFDSVADLWEHSARLFEREGSLRIDLAQVNLSNSAGVALLVEWLKKAKTHEQELELVNIPPQMQAIIKVAELENILPIV